MVEDYIGMTPTGRTTSFRVSMGPKDRVVTSAQTHAVHQDYFEL